MSRLEEIKQHQYDGYTIWDMGEDNLVWLIKQAERVQGLEEDIKEWEIVNESWEEINTDLAEQNKCYKQALEDIRRILDLYPHIDYSKSVTRRRLFDLANEALEGEE